MIHMSRDSHNILVIQTFDDFYGEFVKDFLDCVLNFSIPGHYYCTISLCSVVFSIQTRRRGTGCSVTGWTNNLLEHSWTGADRFS